MRIFGISLVRNERDLIGVTVAHHLSRGLDRVLIADNGSTDGTREILAELSSGGQVTWTSEPGQYFQTELTTALAREAHSLGADWVLPFDADEFWMPTDPLRSFTDVLAETSAGALRVPLRNYVQERRRRGARDPDSLLTMTRSAEPAGSWQEARELVETEQIAFVEMTYPPKFVSRATADLEIAAGNHGVEGLPAPPEDTAALVCLHAPIRSLAALRAKAIVGRRVNEAAWAPGLSWHLRRWALLEDEKGMEGLEAEWAANSFEDGFLDVYGERHEVIADHTLRDAVAPFLAGAPRSPFRKVQRLRSWLARS